MKLDPLLVLEKINQGLTDKEIAKLLDSTEKLVAEVRSTVTERGLVKTKNRTAGYDGPRMDGEARAKRRQQIAAAVDAGESHEEVAKKFEVSIATVGNSVRMYGTRRQQESKEVKQPELLKIAAMLIDGVGDSDIGRAMDLSRERVRLIRLDAEKAGLFDSLKENIKTAMEAAGKKP